MGNRSGETRPGEAAGAVGRRDLLRKVAVLGTGAFAVPMIVTADPADAQALTSPPPEAPGQEPPRATATGPDGPSHRTGGRTRRPVPATDRTELPLTGADIDRLVAAGLAATARGAALVLWGADIRSKSASPRSADPEPET